ncbi:Sucrase/ferredoxin-like-domain-containing protein [Delphinella strobiligena]|nr:Sucrase/ferredoxin-like-domain-containing protein [Delphinella strobiligena]
MSYVRSASRRTLVALGQRPVLIAQQRHASRVAARISFTPPPFPTIDSCPAPTCQCREMPEGLDIEREQALNGSIAAYAEQVLISTGKADWTSKIEDENDAVFLRQMKKFMTRNGKYSDPFHNVLLTNSSMPPTPQSPNSTPEHSTQAATSKPSSVPTARPGSDSDIVPQDTPSSAPASAFLLPTFEYIPAIPTDDSSIEAFIKAFILPAKLNSFHDPLTREQKNILLRGPERRRQFPGARKVDEILVLICGHGGRDQRCGILGPILGAEFEEKLERQNIQVLREAPPALAQAEAREAETSTREDLPAARVGMISHIGGHKFAGNVIIYIPPSFHRNPLAGKGIWYGRVEPQHVEGIVAKTILDGKVIKDHFRGGIGQGGEVLRM